MSHEELVNWLVCALVYAKQSGDTAWLLDPKNTYWAWSDQIVSGEAKGSKYYPHGVTSILWLKARRAHP